MNLEPGVTLISPADADQVVEAAAREACPLYRLSTEGRSGREAFFDTVQENLPLDPPIIRSVSWDALSDSLWEGIHSKNFGRVAILWPNATVMAEESPHDFEIAIGVLADVAHLLSDSTATVGRPMDVCVYIGRRQG